MPSRSQRESEALSADPASVTNCFEACSVLGEGADEGLVDRGRGVHGAEADAKATNGPHAGEN